MYAQRKPLYESLEQHRNSKLIVYVTGDRQGLQTLIADDVYDDFVRHLDQIGVVRKISVFLYTRGGYTATAWSLANLIRSFCDELEFIIPSKANSGGTLMALAGEKIVMTKQATLGPIDPSVNNPLNPQIIGGPPQQKAPVSVEAIKGFFELAKGELKLKGQPQLGQILTAISSAVHPLVLGEAYRIRSQIQVLAERLLSAHTTDTKTIKALVNFLCSESGSHDYAIHRREARKLGLKIENPSAELYGLIKAVYEDIAEELEFATTYNPLVYLGADQQKEYSFHRGLLETVVGGSNVFLSEGQLFRQPGPPNPNVPAQIAIHDQRRFEGWRRLYV